MIRDEDGSMEKTLGELASSVEGELHGDAEMRITGVAGLDEAQASEISFIVGIKYAEKAKTSRAGALIVPSELREIGKPLIVTENPLLAFAKILTLFTHKPRPALGVSGDAYIGTNVKLGEEVFIHPQVYLGDDTVLGDRVSLHAGAYVGTGVHIGDDTLIYPNVTVLDRCVIGDRVTIHAGTVIGSDGFGYVQDGESHFKIPQVGIVQIDDDVEIGANCTVDRATMGKTWIKRGVKIDNLVQIAHNVVIGENSIIIGQVGISGSTKIGKNVILAGQVGVADHLEIGDDARVGAQSGIHRSISPGQTVMGYPAVAGRDFWRNVHMISRLPEMRKRLTEMEKKLTALERVPDTGLKE
jgi:UDP-3-O-[3-hydroxymyristoyl] glucosamine N-acyltransferase